MQSARLLRPQHLIYISKWSAKKRCSSPLLLRRQYVDQLGSEPKATHISPDDDAASNLGIVDSIEASPKFTMHHQKNKSTLADCVLIVRGISRHLAMDDFLRTVPSSVQVKVFPARRPETLEKTGDYFLVFDSVQDALEWRGNIENVHRIARKYSAKSIMSKNIAPPTGFKTNGQDVSKITQSFTIVPSVSPLFISRYQALTEYQASLAERGGYKKIVHKTDGLLHRVMIRVTGISLSASDVLQSILLDGQRRNMMWDLQLQGDGYQAVEPFKGPDQGAKAKGPDTADPKEGSDEEVPKYGQRYLVSFLNQRSARLFAREWNRRPLPLPADLQKFSFYKSAKTAMASEKVRETLVYAELLW